jgi:4-amino-4-deoxychorismate lyase
MFLFESIRVNDGQVPLLDFHQKRIELSYSAVFKKVSTYNLKECIEPFLKKDGIQKCRFIYDDKNYRVEIIDYQLIEPKRIGWLRIDPNFNYSFKFFNRSFFNKINEVYSACDEIILIQNNEITDSTYCNIVIYINNEWILPKSYLLNGVERSRIISKYNFTVAPVSIDKFLLAKEYKLINSMRPFELVEAKDPCETQYLGEFID